jgi:hypothetical protein
LEGKISEKLASPRVLLEKTEVIIRFNEADPLGIVWHGHYIRYFEDGREAFGKKFGITYLDFYKIISWYPLFPSTVITRNRCGMVKW